MCPQILHVAGRASRLEVAFEEAVLLELLAFVDLLGRPPERERSLMKCVSSYNFLAMKFTTRSLNITGKAHAV